MKKHKIQKKDYKGGILNKVFVCCISLILVIETNLFSRTLNVSTELLYFAGVLVILFWNITIFIKLSKVNINELSTKGTLLLNHSKQNYNLIKKVGWSPCITILVGAVVNNDNYKFVFFTASIIIILFVKYYLFDNIIIFTKDGYQSGFDEMKISKITKIVELERSFVLGNEEYVAFEIYTDKKLIAYDRFFNTDYKYLCKMVSSN